MFSKKQKKINWSWKQIKRIIFLAVIIMGIIFFSLFSGGLFGFLIRPLIEKDSDKFKPEDNELLQNLPTRLSVPTIPVFESKGYVVDNLELAGIQYYNNVYPIIGFGANLHKQEKNKVTSTKKIIFSKITQDEELTFIKDAKYDDSYSISIEEYRQIPNPLYFSMYGFESIVYARMRYSFRDIMTLDEKDERNLILYKTFELQSSGKDIKFNPNTAKPLPAVQPSGGRQSVPKFLWFPQDLSGALVFVNEKFFIDKLSSQLIIQEYKYDQLYILADFGNKIIKNHKECPIMGGFSTLVLANYELYYMTHDFNFEISDPILKLNLPNTQISGFSCLCQDGELIITARGGGNIYLASFTATLNHHSKIQFKQLNSPECLAQTTPDINSIMATKNDKNKFRVTTFVYCCQDGLKINFMDDTKKFLDKGIPINLLSTQISTIKPPHNIRSLTYLNDSKIIIYFDLGDVTYAAFLFNNQANNFLSVILYPVIGASIGCVLGLIPTMTIMIKTIKKCWILQQPSVVSNKINLDESKENNKIILYKESPEEFTDNITSEESDVDTDSHCNSIEIESSSTVSDSSNEYEEKLKDKGNGQENKIADVRKLMFYDTASNSTREEDTSEIDSSATYSSTELYAI